MTTQDQLGSLVQSAAPQDVSRANAKRHRLSLESDKVEAISNHEVADQVSKLAKSEERQQHSTATSYCAFSRKTKLWITAMVTCSGFISPLSLNIYFPALEPISHDLERSVNLINLSITSFQLVQAVAPMFVGDFGDTAGRRPAFILSFAVSLGANVGLALQTNYAALLVLRCVQSLGTSGTLALCYAVVADISSTAERGTYMGIAGIGMTAGPGIGLLLGGILTEYFSWRAVFWFCFIFTATWLVPYAFFVPETCRNVVGNGSVPPEGWNKTFIDWMQQKGTGENDLSSPRPARNVRWPNPFKTLRICSQKDVSILLLLNGILFTSIFMALTILSTSLVKLYGLNQLQVGLCYLPYGVACCLSAVAQGRLLDWNYSRIAVQTGFIIDIQRGDDIRYFPIELCRLQLAAPAIVVGTSALIGYGWALEAKISLAVPLVMLFFVGFGLVGAHSVLNTLIIDLYPRSPATAIAANNLVRCLLSAGGSAIVKLLVDAIGFGWCFTLVGGLLTSFSPFIYLLVRKGPKWREERELKCTSDNQDR